VTYTPGTDKPVTTAGRARHDEKLRDAARRIQLQLLTLLLAGNEPEYDSAASVGIAAAAVTAVACMAQDIAEAQRLQHRASCARSRSPV